MTTPPVTPQTEKKIENRRKQPILPVKDFEDIILQLRADPNCKHCFGRGYLSFSTNLLGGKTMNLCGCAVFGETELLKVLSAQALVSQQVGSMNNAVIECLMRMEKAVAEANTGIVTVQECLKQMALPKPTWWDVISRLLKAKT